MSGNLRPLRSVASFIGSGCMFHQNPPWGLDRVNSASAVGYPLVIPHRLDSDLRAPGPARALITILPEGGRRGELLGLLPFPYLSSGRVHVYAGPWEIMGSSSNTSTGYSPFQALGFIHFIQTLPLFPSILHALLSCHSFLICWLLSTLDKTATFVF
jgi:hypothetical protein